MNNVKERIMEQIRSMDEEGLKKVLGFLDEMNKQKEPGQGVN